MQGFVIFWLYGVVLLTIAVGLFFMGRVTYTSLRNNKTLWAVSAAHLIVLAIGLMLRFSQYDPVVEAMSTDFSQHRGAAEALLSARISEYLLYKGPTVAPWLAIGFWIFGDSTYSTWFLWNSLVLFPLGYIFLTLLSREVIGASWFALLPGLLFALWPPQIVAVRLPATENVAVLAVSFTAWAFIMALRTRSGGTGALAGFAFAASLLARPTFLPLAPLFPLAFLVRLWGMPPFVKLARDRGSLLAAGGFVVAAMVTLAPWGAYLSGEAGRFVPIAVQGDDALFITNSPLGDAAYNVSAVLAEEMVPAVRGEGRGSFFMQDRLADRSELRRYALEYLIHDPFSVLRDLHLNVTHGLEPRNEMAYWASLREPVFHDRAIDEGIILGVHVAGMIGLIAAYNPKFSGIGMTVVRLLWLFGYVAVMLVLIKADIRHRMAFEPLTFVLAAALVASAAASPFALVAEPLRRLHKALLGAGMLLRWGGDQFTLRRALFAAGLLAAVGGTGYLTLQPWRTLHVGPAALVDGTVSVINFGERARPHSVIGLLQPDEDRPWQADLVIDAPREGSYALSARYASALSYPLDVFVNGERQIGGGFAETFGGAYNRFAREWPIGEIRLRQGRNLIRLASSNPVSAQKHDEAVAHFSLAPAVGAALTQAAEGVEVEPSPYRGWTRLRLRQVEPDDAVRLRALIEPVEELRIDELYTARLRYESQGDIDTALRLYCPDEKRVVQRFGRVTNILRQGVLMRLRTEPVECTVIFSVSGHGTIDIPSAGTIEETKALMKGFWEPTSTLSMLSHAHGYYRPGAQFRGPFIQYLKLRYLD